MARTRRDPQRLVRTLCERISEGELVVQVIAELGFTRRDLWKWIEADDKLGALYARAREMQAHALAEQAMQAAHGLDDYAKAIERVLDWEEEGIPDLPEKERMGARTLLNSLRHAAVQRDRLRVDTLKWTAAKLLPKVFSEKHQVEHGTKDDKPLPFTFRIDSPASGDSGS